MEGGCTKKYRYVILIISMASFIFFLIISDALMLLIKYDECYKCYSYTNIKSSAAQINKNEGKAEKTKGKIYIELLFVI